RDRPGAGDRTLAHPPRRARGWHDPRRGGRHRRADAVDAGPGLDGVPRRAQCAARHRSVRRSGGPRLRSPDRARPAGSGVGGSQGARCLPRQAPREGGEVTMSMTELGITVPFEGLELHEHRPAIDQLADAGFHGFWTGEVNSVDGLTPLSLFAGWRSDISISCAVVSAYTRGPALLAMSAAALGEIAPGRARFGIGAGSNVIVGNWNGIPFEDPYTRVAESLRFVRRALTGERVSLETRTFTSEGFRLGRVPAVPPKLVVAALGPRMQRLAAAEADGVVLNFLSAADVETVRSAA